MARGLVSKVKGPGVGTYGIGARSDLQCWDVGSNIWSPGGFEVQNFDYTLAFEVSHPEP